MERLFVIALATLTLACDVDEGPKEEAREAVQAVKDGDKVGDIGKELGDVVNSAGNKVEGAIDDASKKVEAEVEKVDDE